MRKNASAGNRTYIGDEAEIGTRSHVCPAATVRAGSRIGAGSVIREYAQILQHVSIGSNNKIGRLTIVSNHCATGHGVELGEAVGLHPNAEIGARSVVEDAATVGSLSTIGPANRIRSGARVPMLLNTGSEATVEAGNEEAAAAENAARPARAVPTLLTGYLEQRMATLRLHHVAEQNEPTRNALSHELRLVEMALRDLATFEQTIAGTNVLVEDQELPLRQLLPLY